jgi:hypothetical protein
MAIKHLAFAILVAVFALSACTATVSTTDEPHVYFHHYDHDND